jgi:hypothetical protein
MVGARLSRLHWRLAGAWLWPTFALLTLLDAFIGHELPPEGDGQSIGSAWLVGVVAMLIGIAAIAPVLALAIRRVGGGMPRVVAHNYAGTAVIVLVSLALLAVGLAHRATVNADRAALTEAVRRAEIWISARAPSEFRADVLDSSAYTIQDASVYRICVPSHSSARTYCVVVRLGLPRARSVSFSGYEPNSVLGAGTN